MKTLLILIALALIFFIGRHFWRQRQRAKAPAAAPTHLTVRCAHCGLYLPRNEALVDGQHSYCSAEHRNAGPTGG
ncbi:MAG: hypothetical protein HQL47_11165 [Gammaproteobacteria bacterium]|nr:hypothetical protein [Gammaproteobacteria bacterium]